MKRLMIALMAAAAVPALAVAQTQDKDKQHAPQEMLNEATPKMKNPGGTEGLHPPQKAMDEATDVEKAPSASTGASTGESGSSTWNADESKDAKEKAPSSTDNAYDKKTSQ